MTIRRSLASTLDKTGRMPGVRLEIKSLSGTTTAVFDNFVSYRFSSNVIVPVDEFEFEFTAPQDSRPFTAYVQEGDIANLFGNNQLVATGIADQLEVEVDPNEGERARVSGRDLLGQLEDNLAINIDKAPIWGQNITLAQAASLLTDGTRVRGVTTRDAPTTPILFATEPGETRVASLQRMCEPLNCLFWSDEAGNLIVGRPDFAQAAKGTLSCNRTKRTSNVLSMRVTKSATSIPNKIVVLWSDVQDTQIGIPENQIFDNAAVGPSRLRQRGHNVIRTVQTSFPNGADAQSLAGAAEFQAASAANQTLLQALAKRALARANFNEVIVQCVVPGHYNDDGEVYRPDQTYNIDFDRGGIQEKMYLYAVEWNLSPTRGQYTVLSFCRLGTIVSDARIS